MKITNQITLTIITLIANFSKANNLVEESYYCSDLSYPSDNYKWMLLT